jgi:hypothetical protein
MNSLDDSVVHELVMRFYTFQNPVLRSTASQDTVVGIVTGLRSGRPMNRISISDRRKETFLRSVRNGSDAHPAFCSVGTVGYFLCGVKRPGREADHSPPCSAEVRSLSNHSYTPVGRA